MDQEKVETFVLVFRGKEFKYRITPECKPYCEQLQEQVRKLEELEAKYGVIELTDEMLAAIQPDIEKIVAALGLDCAMAEFLRVRA